MAKIQQIRRLTPLEGGEEDIDVKGREDIIAEELEAEGVGPPSTENIRSSRSNPAAGQVAPR